MRCAQLSGTRRLEGSPRAHASHLQHHQQFPPEREDYGLRTQMRRAAVSVASNLAEGCGRLTSRDFRRFVGIAFGSLCELECQMILASDLNLVDHHKANQLGKDTALCKRLILGLMRHLNESVSYSE
ncbi:MAG: four helix bundle protein [Bradymonadia bacterium]